MNSKEVMMQRVNYKSDFKVLMHLTDAQGEALPLRALDFDIVLHSGSNIRTFTATKRGTELTNCTLIRNNDVLILADNHQLGIGRLSAEIIIYNADAQMPDGNMRIVYEQQLDLELVQGNGDDAFLLSSTLTLPVIGYKAGDGISISALTISVDNSVIRQHDILTYQLPIVKSGYKDSKMMLYCNTPTEISDARLYLFIKRRYRGGKMHSQRKRGWLARCAVTHTDFNSTALSFVRFSSESSADSAYIPFDGVTYKCIEDMVEDWYNFTHSKPVHGKYRTYQCALAYGVKHPKRGERIEPLTPLCEFVLYRDLSNNKMRMR